MGHAKQCADGTHTMPHAIHAEHGRRTRWRVLRTGCGLICFILHRAIPDAHGCGSEDVDMSLKNKTCQPASGAQDSRASLECEKTNQHFPHRTRAEYKNPGKRFFAGHQSGEEALPGNFLFHDREFTGCFRYFRFFRWFFRLFLTCPVFTAAFSVLADCPESPLTRIERTTKTARIKG